MRIEIDRTLERTTCVSTVAEFLQDYCAQVVAGGVKLVHVDPSITPRKCVGELALIGERACQQGSQFWIWRGMRVKRGEERVRRLLISAMVAQRGSDDTGVQLRVLWQLFQRQSRCGHHWHMSRH